ncbi:unnamed protein product [Paramecium sonneborni]|uniref:Transmembrane protein n=1 Tax=Paramecium sonneborni TaxID=65129 RepID=A0A8S1N773_9CILI|nr:unnamed protein product [Paramecium sonneborni]
MVIQHFQLQNLQMFIYIIKLNPNFNMSIINILFLLLKSQQQSQIVFTAELNKQLHYVYQIQLWQLLFNQYLANNFNIL